MASHRLTAAPGGPTSVVDRYLTELSARLRGPRSARTRVLSEIHDGLIEATDAHLANGMRPEAATGAAIAEFGEPATVARSFATELATASARRTIATFIATGPLVGIWWLLLLHPTPWRSGALAALVAIPAMPLVALAIATAAGTFATTGRLMRWLPESPASRALTAATAIATLCLATDVTVLAVLTAHLTTGWRQSVPLITVAATASILRIAASIAAMRSIRAERQALGGT